MALPTGDVVSSPSDANLYEVGDGDLYSTTLGQNITAGNPANGATLTLTSVTTDLPDNGVLLVDDGSGNYELIRYEGKNTGANTVTVHGTDGRGFGGTSGITASTGDVVKLVVASYYHDLLAAYIQRLMVGHLASGVHDQDALGLASDADAAGEALRYEQMLDEDDMASNSATKVATQQSIKAYVDAGNYQGLTWNESTDAYTRRGTLMPYAVGSSPGNAALPIQTAMRRCVISDAGVVQYYLAADDSTNKADGTAADLTGADGQVMVEIPKFYYKYNYLSNVHTWDISSHQLPGFKLHPAFMKNGAEVDFRYMGAYEGVLYDTSESKYVNGLYLPSSAVYTISFADNGGADDTITSDANSHAFTNLEAGVDKIVVSGSTVNDGTYDIKSVTDTVITLETGSLAGTQANDQCIIQVQRDWTASSGDVLGSVSGKAPMDYGTRANFRAVADNRGTGWRQLDFYLASAIQLLYLVEYADFYSQSMIGNGLTDWSTAWPAWNNSNPIETTGNSNSDGNVTVNTSGGDGVVGSYMTYRGIENWYGHIWQWVDGFNINSNVPYFSNTDTQFADDTSANYDAPGGTLHNANGYQGALEQIDEGFLPADVTGTATTKITDYYYQNSGWRVAALGGIANDGALAGGFGWNLSLASSFLARNVGSQVSY